MMVVSKAMPAHRSVVKMIPIRCWRVWKKDVGFLNRRKSERGIYIFFGKAKMDLPNVALYKSRRALTSVAQFGFSKFYVRLCIYICPPCWFHCLLLSAALPKHFTAQQQTHAYMRLAVLEGYTRPLCSANAFKWSIGIRVQGIYMRAFAFFCSFGGINLA